LKGRLYLLKEGLVLLAVVSLLLLLSVGFVRLLQGNPDAAEAGRDRPISVVELRLKDLIRAAIVEQDSILSTKLLNNALDSILRRLLETQDPIPYEVEVLILDSPVVNAVAFPGGSQAKVLVQRIMREVVNIQFSKNVEARADAFALDLLIQARIDPIHFAEALEHLSEDRKKPVYLKYIDGHPEIETRIE